MILTLRTATTADVTEAAALLYRALLASPTGRLLGSATTTGLPTFADVIIAGLCFGRVDLAVSGDRIDGVASWIDHLEAPTAAPAATATLRRSRVDDLFGRLHTIDLVVPVPDHQAHQHLACLGTRPGHQARATADLLLHRQSLLSDRHGHPFYTEVHDQPFRAWLLRAGYHDHGVSLGTDTAPESHLLSYLGAPP